MSRLKTERQVFDLGDNVVDIKYLTYELNAYLSGYRSQGIQPDSLAQIWIWVERMIRPTSIGFIKDLLSEDV